MTPELSIIIPLRAGAKPTHTLHSLGLQTYQRFEVVLSQDEHGNANWARNRGFELVSPHSKYLLFCDDDITWHPCALERMVGKLETAKHAAYAYCGYRIGERIQCNREFSAAVLRRQNFISTMSVIRRERFIGFDEDITRLQDWDMWLGMLSRGDVGAYCGEVLFETYMREGITYSPNSISYQDAVGIIMRKHGIV